MKSIKILVLVSILTVTQSFAFSKTQRNILLGIGAGAIIVHALESNNSYEKPHNKIVYVNSYRNYKKHQMRKNHNRGHKHYSRSNRHNKHYRRNHHRYDSIAVNNHHRRAYSRY